MENKSITLISGTRKGIGKALAQHYLKQGHRVIGCSRRAADWSHPNYCHYEGDIADESFVKTLLFELRKKHHRLDYLINNAGIASMNHCLLTPTRLVERMMQTNFLGTFLLCREAAKLMAKHQFGRIVNFTTVAVPLHLEGEAVYAATKAAVMSLSQVLAKELGGYGITVNAVGPTPVKTDLIRAVPEEKIDKLLNQQAIKRFGKLSDISNVIDFFLKKESAFITGQTIFLGGVV
ncbi:MAG: SDR family oxidoreductase [Pseudomonadota bacterium]